MAKHYEQQLTVSVPPEQTAQCSFPLQLVDYGKNRKNVEYVVAGLQPPPDMSA